MYDVIIQQCPNFNCGLTKWIHLNDSMKLAMLYLVFQM